MKERWKDATGKVVRVHPKTQCAGEWCSIHNPSDHPLKDAPQIWREDRRIMERVCQHGVGHPDPDCIYAQHDSIHGCDGCCFSQTKEG